MYFIILILSILLSNVTGLTASKNTTNNSGKSAESSVNNVHCRSDGCSTLSFYKLFRNCINVFRNYFTIR